jgi:hypothetical protein
MNFCCFSIFFATEPRFLVKKILRAPSLPSQEPDPSAPSSFSRPPMKITEFYSIIPVGTKKMYSEMKEQTSLSWLSFETSSTLSKVSPMMAISKFSRVIWRKMVERKNIPQ